MLSNSQSPGVACMCSTFKHALEMIVSVVSGYLLSARDNAQSPSTGPWMDRATTPDTPSGAQPTRPTCASYHLTTVSAHICGVSVNFILNVYN